MKTLVALLFALIAFAMPSVGQRNLDWFPTVSVTVDPENNVLALHQNGLVTLSAIDEEGNLIVAFAGAAGEAGHAIDNIPGDPVPMLTTRWTDAQGVTHEVVTPIIGTTETALKKAIELHERLVALRQATHPPAPVPHP